jgi:tRNA(adenine34) deaminase
MHILRPAEQPDPVKKIFNSEHWMREALREAQKSACRMEIPVGAVLVLNNKIVARGHNLSEKKHDFLQHAELLVLQKASRKIRRWKIQEAELYVTLEPCAMCAGAIILSRVKKVIYGARDPKAGADGSAADVLNNSRINHRVQVEAGVLAAECGTILTEFFKKIRNKRKE